MNIGLTLNINLVSKRETFLCLKYQQSRIRNSWVRFAIKQIVKYSNTKNSSSYTFFRKVQNIEYSYFILIQINCSVPAKTYFKIVLSLIIQSSQPFNVIIMMLVGSTGQKDEVSYPSYVFCSFSFCYHAINLILHQRDHIKGSFLCIVMLLSFRQCTLLSFIFICSCSCLITNISVS